MFNPIDLSRKAMRRILRIVDCVYRRIMFFIFQFDRWHLMSYYDKPYTQQIVAHCNVLEVKGSVIEIGCGFGDILRRLRYKSKIGYDISARIIKAAKLTSWLHLDKSKFADADFFSLDISFEYDCIILVNWIHEIAPAVLKQKVTSLFSNNLKIGGEIIIDVIHDNQEYQYNHEIEYLFKALSYEASLLCQYSYGRKVFAIKKKG